MRKPVAIPDQQNPAPTAAEHKVGTGWISGVFAIMDDGAVLCFRYPSSNGVVDRQEGGR